MSAVTTVAHHEFEDITEAAVRPMLHAGIRFWVLLVLLGAVVVAGSPVGRRNRLHVPHEAAATTTIANPETTLRGTQTLNRKCMMSPSRTTYWRCSRKSRCTLIARSMYSYRSMSPTVRMISGCGKARSN